MFFIKMEAKQIEAAIPIDLKLQTSETVTVLIHQDD